jgi:hypothetical protein
LEREDEQAVGGGKRGQRGEQGGAACRRR